MDDPSAPLQDLPPARSQASGNWRQKTDMPRYDAQPQARNQRSYGQNRNNEGGASSGSNVPETRLYVGNLLYTAERPEVEAFFTDHGFQISGISMSIDPFTNRNRSYAFVDFETVEEAQRAMTELNGQELLGRAVKINPGMRREAGAGGPQGRGQGFEGDRRGGDRAGGRMDMQGGYGRGGGYDQSPGGYGQSSGGYGQSSDSYRSRDSPRPENPTRLYVGNLPAIEPQETLEAEMANLFQGLQLKSVSRLIAPHESRAGEPGNHHYCFVDFQTPDEAEQAVEAYAGKESPWGGELRINKARDNRQKREYGGPRQGPYSRPDRESGGMTGGGWR